ncbi:MAG TPA: EAL domain-containing protein [Pseudolabrys sp.]|nr:EAL domain-containing protein [Pseudolabrys sp.]
MQARARPRSAEERQYTSWDRARLSIVVPIGVIVAVAIVCIVVTVLSSAEHADRSAVDRERQLVSRAIENYGTSVLREMDSVISTDAAIYHIRDKFDRQWVQQHLGLWLESFFDQNLVFIVDENDRLIYSLADKTDADTTWFKAARQDIDPVIVSLRKEASPGAPLTETAPATIAAANRKITVARKFLGRPAIVTAVTVGPSSSLPGGHSAPIVVSVKYIDDTMLANVSARLRLTNLHMAGSAPAIPREFIYNLRDPAGTTIARFAWAPQQPGADIVNSVVPFIAVALAGFALLAAFVLRYMRRTAAAISAGETRLRHLAMHDPLCGLPNRIFFGERLEAVIEEVRDGRPPAAVFYIDLDHFKEVNDTLGHPIGDELIRNVTLRLSHTLRGDDLVARLGGDEFAVISSVGSEPDKMMTMAQRLIATICAPYLINKQTIVIGASIGIAAIEKKSGDAADIMRYADIALYRAKNEGRNRACVYDAAMDADLSNRKLLEADLRHTIENGALRLLYQPLVNNSGATIVGVEALCRWTHPQRGPISPAEFIAIAEHSGLINELGQWVLRRACTDGLAWPGISVAVNVSPLQFRRSDFYDIVHQTLAETGFDPARLELELTESTLIGNAETAEASMIRLKALGIRLALDDFGTGYSSLQYLRRFPFDKLKIDQSFVSSIEKAADAAAIVHAVVSLGRGLGMKVTAEGVETADQHLFLRAAGVHSMQGYRFGKPMTAAEISQRLQTPGARPGDEIAAFAG